MGEQEGSVKRKSRLAVFEHIIENEKKLSVYSIHRKNSDNSSASESELVIDERSESERKKKNPLIKLTEEVLTLTCHWIDCEEVYNSWEKFNNHLTEHAINQSGNLICQWKNCVNQEIETIPLLMQHMSYHGYISKLKSIGQNISQRNKLPACTESHTWTIPLFPTGYRCEWEHCSFNFCTIYEFLLHMNVHIKNNPKAANSKEAIPCCWTACKTKYSTQTKLADHLKIHTKEKVIGCFDCGRLFSNKTKFCDHRKRQLSSELQSYQCSQCLKLFPTERLLRDHIRSHVNHYKCTMCDMTCPKPSILAKHIRFKHVNFRPYKCAECDKTFVEKHNLNTHLKTHNVESRFKCGTCDFECLSSVGLQNHYVKKHDGTRLVYECHCCKKKFRRGRYLTKHLTKQHNYHWPSGHSRFRYRKDQDGIYRLQTVRYESLEVTQQMIRSESMQTGVVKENISYKLKYQNDGYVLSISENGEQHVEEMDQNQEDNNVLITINDLDEEGNILKCEVVETTLLPANELSTMENVVRVGEHNIVKPKKEIDFFNRTNSNDTDTSNLKVETKLKISKEEPDKTILDYEIFKNN